MTEPSSGTPSPLPAEPAEPSGHDPEIAPGGTLDAELGADDGRDLDEEPEDEDEDEESELGEEDDKETELEPEPTTEAPVPGAGAATPPGTAARRRAGAPVVQRAPTQSELAVRVTDNASRIFVIATVVVFSAILAFGLLAGNGGFFTPIPSPTVAPSASVVPSASVAPSASAAQSSAPSASAAASAAPS